MHFIKKLFIKLHIVFPILVVFLPIILPLNILKNTFYFPIFFPIIWILCDGCPITNWDRLCNNKKTGFVQDLMKPILGDISIIRSEAISTIILILSIIISTFRLMK